MSTEDEFEIDLRPRARLLLTSGGTFAVLDHADVVRAKLEDSSPSDLIAFGTYREVGDPARIQLDPCKVWIERAGIAGVMEVTKRAWEDEQADRRQAAMTPRMTSFGIQTP